MKNLRLVTMWPLIGIGFFFALFMSCKKDNFDVILKSSNQAKGINISEAKSYFEQLKLSNQSSFEGDTARILNIGVEPLWNEAFLSNSTSGREIVVVPLADTTISTLNHGRAGVKLLFSRFGGDTIVAEVLFYIADSTYFLSNNQDLSFNDFTGVFVLSDIGLHFKYGVNVVNGTPVGRVKDVYKGNIQSIGDEREGGDCFDVYEVAYEPCVYTFDECDVPVVVQSEECNDPVNGGGGGSGGGNGGGGTGGNGGGGGGSGGGGGGGGQIDTLNYYPNPWENVDYHVIFTLVPVHIFVQGGGNLPPGLSVDEAGQLVQLNNVCHFNNQQLDWLVTHSLYIGTFHSHLNKYGNHAETIQAIKAIIDAMTANPTLVSSSRVKILLQVQQTANFTPAQLDWAINHQEVLQGCSDFQNEFNGFDGIEDATQLLVEYIIRNQIEDILEADFADYEESSPSCTPCFVVAVSVEYAFLKLDNPGPDPIQNPIGAKIHKAKLIAQATWNVSSTEVHLVLDLAGLVPIFGEVADLTSGGIYTLEGEYADASLSFSAAIPIGGWLATGTKYARKIVTVSGKTTNLIMIVGEDGLIKFGKDVYEGREQLRRALNTPFGHQAHHIIPWELREHPVVQAAASVGNNSAFHMNEILNGISLPNSLGSGLPQHLGSHPNYTEKVRESLTEIQNQLGSSMNPTNARQKLIELVGSIETRIQATSGGTIDAVSGW